jgi:hypothetical protein
MDRLAATLASPAGVAAIAAAALWAPVTGFPTWPALARGRCASTVLPSLAVGLFAFTFVQRLAAPALA